jgi:hypothetical protein
MAFTQGSRRDRQTSDVVQDFYNYISDANLTMTVKDNVVLVTLTDANNSTVTLPSVSESFGREFVIRLVAVGSGAVTIEDKSNDAAMTSLTLAVAGEYAHLFSDGLKWMNSLASGATSSASLTVSGATALNGGLTMDTNKFTVADASGDTVIAGTLAVTGAQTMTGLLNANGGIAVDTNAFTVADTTGITVIAGLLNANGGIAVDTSAFTVADTTGAVACGDIQCKGGDIDAGLSGTAGSVDIFPSTVTSGKLAITCADQTGDTTVSLVAGTMAGATTITLRDPGAAASFVTTTDATAAATTATAAEITLACDISAKAVVALTGTAAITAADHAGRICYITGSGSAYTYTLPEATGTGHVYTFIMGEVNTSNTVFTTADATNADYRGQAQLLDLDGSTISGFAPAATDELITLNGTTTGGAIGDKVVITDIATDVWQVNITGNVPAGSNPATPFSGV